MKIHVEIDEKQLKSLVYDYLLDKLGNVSLRPEDVKIEVKSKQNWKAEWEEALFRARVESLEA